MNDNAIPHPLPQSAVSDAPAEPLAPPWGFWSTSAWAALAFLLGAVIVGGLVVWLIAGDIDKLPEAQDDPWFPLQLIVVNAVQVGVLIVAARLGRSPVAQYLGLTRPRGRDILYGIATLALVMGALEILTHVVGRESLTPFQTESYRAARAAGLLPLLWLAFVIVAPISEEVTFRGFIFRGWAASPLGPVGTILLTSAIFSALHPQYDWFGMFQTFCVGTLFGYLRWRSGSTTVVILLHVIVNFISTLFSAIKVAGLV